MIQARKKREHSIGNSAREYTQYLGHLLGEQIEIVPHSSSLHKLPILRIKHEPKVRTV